MRNNLLIIFLSLLLFAFVPQEEAKGLKIGDKAPNFTAINQNSENITLNNFLKEGSIVLLFYRGEWCPYCTRQLAALEDSLSFITAKGAKVIAISPEKAENITKTIQKSKATYSVVTDETGSIMKEYGVAFKLDSATTIKYKGYGINLIDRNGNSGNSLPIPAVYIINKEGKITYRYFDVNYRKRASVIDIINHL